MKKYNTLITIGIITAFIPLLGIPKSWKYFFTIVAGVTVALISYMMRRATLPTKGTPERETPSYARTYIENNENI